MSSNFSFIVADDHSVVRRGISFLLKDLYPGANVFLAASFSDILRLVESQSVDLLLLDVNFPDGSSLGLIPAIKKLQPNIKILIFSALDEDVYAIRYLNVGANGYLNKLCADSDIKKAVDAVIFSGKFVSENIRNKIMDSFIFKKPTNPLEQLSNREIEIAKLLVEGYGNNTISDTLNIKKTTVSTYKTRIFEKLEIETLPSLINLFNLYYSDENNC